MTKTQDVATRKIDISSNHDLLGDLIQVTMGLLGDLIQVTMGDVHAKFERNR